MRVVILLLIVVLLPTASAGSPVFNIVAGTRADGSMYFTPDDLVVTEGDSVTIHVKNLDTNPSVFHDLAVLNWEGPRRHLEWEVDAGQTTSRTFKADQGSGKWDMICEVPNHKELGMKGSFTVESKGLPAWEAPILLALLLGLGLVLRRRR